MNKYLQTLIVMQNLPTNETHNVHEHLKFMGNITDRKYEPGQANTQLDAIVTLTAKSMSARDQEVGL